MTERPRFLLGRALWTHHAGGSMNPRTAVLLIDVEDRDPSSSRKFEASPAILLAAKIANGIGAKAALKTVSRQHCARRVHRHTNGDGVGEMAVPIIAAVRPARDGVVAAASSDQREKQGGAKDYGRDVGTTKGHGLMRREHSYVVNQHRRRENRIGTRVAVEVTADGEIQNQNERLTENRSAVALNVGDVDAVMRHVVDKPANVGRSPFDGISV